MNTYHVYTVCMSPALNRSSALECYKRSNAIKICNRIMFDFYPGLPYMKSTCTCVMYMYMYILYIVSYMSPHVTLYTHIPGTRGFCQRKSCAGAS